jgi:Uma2 family endonuclease
MNKVSTAMPVLVMEPLIAERLRAEREATDGAKHDEVWNGVTIMSPLPNNEHQLLASQLWLVFHMLLTETGGGTAFDGVNVSDREEGWLENFREPDVAVFLKGNPAKDCGTHWCGGPDLAVEILSPKDLAREKRPFYARIGVRELLIVDRDPWALELYRLDGGELGLVGLSTLEQPDSLSSAVLPLVFRLVPGTDRPALEVGRADGSQKWEI